MRHGGRPKNRNPGVLPVFTAGGPEDCAPGAENLGLVPNLGARSSRPLFLLFLIEKNGLSFIETSALDSTNVEAAFQTILTGELAGGT